MTPQTTYLIAVFCTFAPLWLLFFLSRKDQRNEIWKMSFLVGLLSVATSYLWWVQDWWTPQNITGTKVGVEDFLLGFFAGGVMSSGYEIIQRLYDVQNKNLKKLGRTHGFIILTLLILICSFLFWELGLLSAVACFSAISVGILYTYFIRFDLWRVSIGSGLVMLLCSLPFYLFLIVLAPEWIAHTYPFDVLTGFKIYGVPIEEFIFWFLAGAMFGPFYEVLNGLREYRK